MKINKNLNIQTENLHGEKIIIIDDFIEEFSNIHEIDENSWSSSYQPNNIPYPLGKRYGTEFTNTKELLSILNKNYSSLESQIVKFVDKIDYTELTPKDGDSKFEKFSQYTEKPDDTPFSEFDQIFGGTSSADKPIETLKNIELPHNKWLMENIKKEMFVEHPGRPHWRFDDDYIGYVFLTDFSKTNLPEEANYIIPKPNLSFYKNLHWTDKTIFKWDKDLEKTPLTWYMFWYNINIRALSLYKTLINLDGFTTCPITLDEHLLNPAHTLNDFERILSIEGKFNRCILFPGNLFHSQSFNKDWALERTMATITFK
tara:strand:- start:504 stop:1448 length:945 start_codon:yes stop_codon:yes gene_type:complete